MRVYVIKQDDLERLLAFVDRNPEYGQRGGSSQAMTDAERQAHDRAHSFFNFQIRRWIDEVTR
jgi:hypothetical protein